MPGENDMRDFAKKFYKSKAWQNVREFVIQRDKNLCVDCMKRGKVTPAEEVHHVIELTPDNIGDPSISLSADNLVSLCRECHKARHGSHDHGSGEKRYKIDERGRVIFS